MRPEQLREYALSWERSLRSRGLSPNSVRAYGDSVRALARWQEEQHQSGLSRAVVEAYLVDVLNAPPAPGRRGDHSATAHLRGRVLRQFSAWMAEEGEISRDELAGMPAPKMGETVVDGLTEAQLVALIKVCESGKDLWSKRDAAYVRLDAETGARTEEMLKLDYPRDIDLTRKIALLHGKGNRERRVPFEDKTAAAIDRYLRARRKAGIKDEGPLFISQQKRRLSYSGLHTTLEKRAALAGIADFHPHRLRHSMAARWLANGGSEGGLMAVAGWKRRDMVDRYVAHTRAELAADEARRLKLGDL